MINIRQKQDLIFICIIDCIIACLLLVSCGGKVNRDTNGNKIIPSTSFTIVVYDGCQYLEYPGYLAFHYTHKGNCNNPIHQGKGEH